MRKLSHFQLATLALAVALVGCQAVPGVLSRAPSSSLEAPASIPRLQGQVSFPSRETAATTGDVINRATVSVLDMANQTVAVSVTTATGGFTLDVNGTFTPTAGAYYVVEAVKGLSNNAASGNAVRMRTLLQWTGTAWNSCTGAVTILINPTTTAVALIKNTQPTVTYAETMGVVSGSTVTTGNATLGASWQTVQNLVNDLLWRDVDPVLRIGLSGGVYSAVLDRVALVQPKLSVGTFSSTSPMLDGSLQLTGSLPTPTMNDEVYFSTNLPESGVLANDGKYLYSKRWDAAGSWTRIGTGYGSTTQGTNYGVFGAATTRVNNAGFFGGYVYQPYDGNRSLLERLNTTNGVVDTVSLGTPLLNRSTGLTEASAVTSYINSDGKYLYSGAFSINNGGYNGYTLRVYDPANSFAFFRQITLDGANTPLANTSYYTDSMMVDGVYLYCMEWNMPSGGAATAARMRRYRLDDGQLETEYSFPQSNPDNDPLTGSYDWVNNKFWFGNHASGSIHRTEGRLFPASGTWTSAPLDMGGASPIYGRLSFNAVSVNGQTVRLQLRTASDPAGLDPATWYGPTGTGDYYTASGTPINPVHRQRWVQVRATLTPETVSKANTTPRLYGVTVEAIP